MNGKMDERDGWEGGIRSLNENTYFFISTFFFLMLALQGSKMYYQCNGFFWHHGTQNMNSRVLVLLSTEFLQIPLRDQSFHIPLSDPELTVFRQGYCSGKGFQIAWLAKYNLKLKTIFLLFSEEHKKRSFGKKKNQNLPILGLNLPSVLQDPDVHK